jgi:hypothetical protein
MITSGCLTITRRGRGEGQALVRPATIGTLTIVRSARTIWIAGAHRDDGKRFIVHADEMLTAFLELETAIHEFAVDAMK